MINNDRIVPITATDLISMYGLILVVGAATAPEKLDADTVLGNSITATEKLELRIICSCINSLLRTVKRFQGLYQNRRNPYRHR